MPNDNTTYEHEAGLQSGEGTYAVEENYLQTEKKKINAELTEKCTHAKSKQI